METCNEIVAARKWCQQTLFCRGLQPKKLIRSRNNKLLKHNNVKINHIENDSHEKRALKTFLYSRSARQRCMKASVPIDGHGHNYMIYVHTSRLSIYILTPTFRVRNIFTIIFFATRAKIWIAHISAGPFFFLRVFFGSNNSLFYVRSNPSDAHAQNISAAPATLFSSNFRRVKGRDMEGTLSKPIPCKHFR